MQHQTERIWTEFGAPLKGFILSRVLDELLVDDILQDVFLKIHSHIETLKNDTDIRGWIYRITRNTIKAMIEALPEPYAQALILTEYQGLSQKELAQNQGISVSGAKSRVQRARKMLKQRLLEYCHFEFDCYGNIIDYHPTPRSTCTSTCSCCSSTYSETYSEKNS